VRLNRREFLRFFGIGAVASVLPALPKEEESVRVWLGGRKSYPWQWEGLQISAERIRQRIGEIEEQEVKAAAKIVEQIKPVIESLSAAEEELISLEAVARACSHPIHTAEEVRLALDRCFSMMLDNLDISEDDLPPAIRRQIQAEARRVAECIKEFCDNEG